jgi:hypothetical protein
MEEEKSLSLASYKTDGYNMGMALMLASMVLSWMFIHRWNQRHKKGPTTWPIVGAAMSSL